MLAWIIQPLCKCPLVDHFYHIIMTYQTGSCLFGLLHLHTCQFFPINPRPSMINYFEFQLPDPNHSHDQFQQLHSPPHSPLPLPLDALPLLPLEEIQLNHALHSPLHCDFAETLESDVHPIFQAPFPPQDLPVQNLAEAPYQKVKNETKNIPKNFGKGIISFIEKNERKVRSLLRRQQVTYSCFIEMMREEKKRINTIQDLRRLWTHEVYGRSLRIISNLFFRRYALDYIFNSRISNYASHIKYRQSLWKAIQNPNQFNRIKEF